MNPHRILDPVAAYDQVAPFFPQLSQERRNYLRGIEELVIARIPPGSHSLLDVGAGDGSRTARIASGAGLSEVVLLEPSSEMIRSGANRNVEIWPIRVEDLIAPIANSEGSTNTLFDVITCLWNVLGHVGGADTRARVFTQLGNLLAPAGRIFFDVNHRYNIKSYGLIRTAFRFYYDRSSPQPTNGDVEVTWRFGEQECRTRGHVFTDREIQRLASAAELVIEERIVLDYDTGKLRRFGCLGNLLYVLRPRNSSNDSASASQTS